MNKQREALQQALEALECALDGKSSRTMERKAIREIKEALAEPEKANQCGETCERAKLCAVCANGLAEPEQEPVAWRIADERDWEYRTEPPREQDIRWGAQYGRKYEPLYTAPPARKPLTDEELFALRDAYAGHLKWGVLDFARAIERAHGIT